MATKSIVTGGAGFIGSSLVRELLNSGEDRVGVIDNLNSGKLANKLSLAPKGGGGVLALAAVAGPAGFADEQGLAAHFFLDLMISVSNIVRGISHQQLAHARHFCGSRSSVRATRSFTGRKGMP